MQVVSKTLSFQTELASILSSNNKQKILLLTHRSFDLPDNFLVGFTIKHIPFGTARLNADEINKLKEQISIDYDAIVSIGGGSIIDCAKILKNRYFSEDFFHVAVPTTTGSGAEATHFAVIYEGLQKRSIAFDYLLPDHVILCPSLVQTLPAAIKISSGLDALAQSIESFYSLNSNDDSVSYAMKSLDKIRTHLFDFVEGEELIDAQEMQEAAYLAGRAINISKTTLAHALSYYLTSKFKVPHGVAVFLSLPAIVVKYPANSELFSLFEVGSADELAEELKRFTKRLGVATSLTDYGVHKSDLIDIVQTAIQSGRAGNSPWNATENELIELLEGLL